jgi:hypothetical protein
MCVDCDIKAIARRWLQQLVVTWTPIPCNMVAPHSINGIKKPDICRISTTLCMSMLVLTCICNSTDLSLGICVGPMLYEYVRMSTYARCAVTHDAEVLMWQSLICCV